MTKKEKAFVAHVRSECKKHGFSFQLRRTKNIVLSKQIKCAGYFDDTEKALVCARNRKDWLEILVHEYGHLTQWEENCDAWKNSGSSITKIDEWIAGKPIRNIQKHLAASRDLELDNEKRSVKIIKKFDLNIDIDNYIRKANAYVQSYNLLLLTRVWLKPKHNPYTNKKIIAAMPSTFRMNYNKIPRVMEQAYKEFMI